MIGKVSLGSTGEQVSELALGTMYMGSRLNDEASGAMIEQYLEMGGSFLDTANNYAHWLEGCDGSESECCLGRWFQRTGKRAQVFLATKVGFDKRGGGRGLRAYQIVENCEQSLENLQTDVIDLYYAHTDDRATPLEETLEAFDRLRRQGKVRYLGASNHTPWRMEEALHLCRERGFSPYVCIQERFTYLRATPCKMDRFHIDLTDDVMDYAKARNLTLLAYSPLLQGFYVDTSRPIPPLCRGDFNHPRLHALLEVAKELGGVSLNQLVLKWMRSQEATVIPLISGDTPAQVMENIKSLELSLSAEQLERLNDA